MEVTPKKEVIWEISKTIPGSKIKLGWMTALQELPNGNIVAGNCHAGEENPQIFEITKKGLYGISTSETSWATDSPAGKYWMQNSRRW